MSETPTLRYLIDELYDNPPVFARANAKGKFPMAAMRLKADKSSYDLEPLTVAMTEATFERIKTLVAALPQALDVLP